RPGAFFRVSFPPGGGVCAGPHDEAPFAALPGDFEAPGDAFVLGGDRAPEFAARLRALGKRARIAQAPALPRADLFAPSAARCAPVAKLVPIYIHPPAITQEKPR
ncbi:MAG: hypothetical protein ACOVQI_05865, partial [Tagaea sp.]